MHNHNTPNPLAENPKKNGINRAILQNSRILLVEDNKINQDVALAMLHQRGIVVDTAENGEQAVKMVEENKYDCVLMDLKMPVMDGHTATRIIRKKLNFENLPILAMTAKVLEVDINDALEAGMNCHIPKPIDLGLLLNEIAYWIAHSKGLEFPITEENSEEQQKRLKDCLEKVGGDKDLFMKILNVFLEKHSSDYELTKQLLEEGDTKEARKLVHSLKGVAPVVGAEALHATTVDLEAGLLADPCDDVTPLMDDFKINLQNTVSCINGYLDRNQM
jgi:CheY-like chemotaxis protein/HPt (histidine-containing phosphotransfer) domain-containing protein